LTLRPIAKCLSGVFGHQVIVENRAGANGNIGANFVAESVPNGYKLLFASTSQLTINPSLYGMPFDAMKDFAPIGQATVNPSVIVLNAVLPMSTVKELIAYAKARTACWRVAIRRFSLYRCRIIALCSLGRPPLERLSI